MNRLESIKERVQNGITEYMHDANKAGIYREDATYLLQRLETAQKALEFYSNKKHWTTSYYHSEFGKAAVQAMYKSKPWENADEALDQLKE